MNAFADDDRHLPSDETIEALTKKHWSSRPRCACSGFSLCLHHELVKVERDDAAFLKALNLYEGEDGY